MKWEANIMYKQDWLPNQQAQCKMTTQGPLLKLLSILDSDSRTLN